MVKIMEVSFTPLAVASGIRCENVELFLPHVDAFLVASDIEERLGVLSLSRTRELAESIHR
jgi:predicted TIM-barrel enzyme